MEDAGNNGKLDLRAMADAFVYSSKRSRYIVIVIVFTSVIAFIAFWNTLGHSWIRSRVRVAFYALNHNVWELRDLDAACVDTLAKVWAMSTMGVLSTHIDSLADSTVVNNLDSLYKRGLESAPELNIIENLPLSQLFPLFEEEKAKARKMCNIDSLFTLLKKLADDKKRAQEVANKGASSIDTSVVDSLFSLVAMYKDEKDMFRQAQNLCRYRQFTEETLCEYAKHLDHIRTERVLMIPIPIFGVMLDVNDLGVLGGLAFTVLLLWLRIGLSRELTNLRIVFRRAEEEKVQREICYLYLSMLQVLTIPRAVRGMPLLPYRRFWVVLPKVLFFLPFIVQAIVLHHDWQTLSLGEISNPTYARWGLVTGLFFLGLILLLTMRCVFLSIGITKEWNRVADELEKDRPNKIGELENNENSNT